MVQQLKRVISENSGVSLGVAAYLAVGLVGYGVLYANVEELKKKQSNADKLQNDVTTLLIKVENIEKILERRR